jgi:hypothetical protein
LFVVCLIAALAGWIAFAQRLLPGGGVKVGEPRALYYPRTKVIKFEIASFSLGVRPTAPGGAVLRAEATGFKNNFGLVV